MIRSAVTRLTRGLLFLSVTLLSNAAEPKADPRYPFRTDFANSHLPWYQLQPVEFPPYHSDSRIGGALVAVDFIHRSGVFQKNGTGELMSFTLPPYGTVHYLSAPADLRDVPLGTFFLFFLHQDENGAFTKAATMQDDFTMSANHHSSYRLDQAKIKEGKLIVTRQKLPSKDADGTEKEWWVSDKTRVWKGDRQVTLNDLAVGDELLANFTGSHTQTPRRCSDIWISAETHQHVSQQQRAKHAAFLKARGLPAWITLADNKQIVVDLLGSDEPEDRNALRAVIEADFAVGKGCQVAVANDELRGYWPNVDGKKSKIVKVEYPSGGVYGFAGVRLTLEPVLMLEGFRRGRIVRVYAEKWPVTELPLGEGLLTELTSAEANEVAAREYPDQFPYRTDYGNRHLPWYQLKAGEIPPRYSEHRVYGEILKVDAASRSGQFRKDRTDELVDFTLTPEGALVYVNTNSPDNTGPVKWESVPASVLYLNAPALLEELPLGTRCCFHLYQDEKGAFTRASLITDEFSSLAINKVTWCVEALWPDTGCLQVTRRLPPRKQLRLSGYDQPPDIGRARLTVDDRTRVWKGERQIQLTEIAVGDEILVNFTGETATTLSRCTDLWIGKESVAQVTEARRNRGKATLAPLPK